MATQHADLVPRGAGAAEQLERRLDRPMGVLGIVFVLVVLGQSVATDPAMATALAVAGWVLWAVFGAELALRAYVARDQRRFWTRNWWQVVFLVVPFLRFARALALLRTARIGAVVSSAVRGSRSAGRLLGSRLGWLAALTAVVVLAASQVLYLLGTYGTYGHALHDAALATVTGEPLSGRTTTMTQVMEVVLAVYSVAVFAGLAAALGAYFLDRPPVSGRAGPAVPVRSRTAEEVVLSHLDRRQAGDLEGDLRLNYAPDVVLLSAEGVHRGHDGVRRLARVLRSYVPAGNYSYEDVLVDGDVGLLAWSAQASDTVLHDGADSYVVRDGAIVGQTIHYSATSRSG